MEGEDFLNEEQLLDFCQRLGLGLEDGGYINEHELTVICRCIGLQVPEEMMKDLFEELDVNKQGKVSLENLSHMLKSMSTNGGPSSPQKMKINNNHSSNIESVETTTFSFSLLDPLNSGMAKVELLLDYWSSMGLSQEQGRTILKQCGIDTRYDKTVNLNELRRCIEEEVYTNKTISPSMQAILVMYRSESQFLKSSLESTISERDKLRLDIEALHLRSETLAQEVDEQNSKLEQNNSKLLQHLTTKYEEQIMELQAQFRVEKELLAQTLQATEAELSNLKEEEVKLKIEIQSLIKENKNLEREVERLSNDMRALHRNIQQLENEISRYQEMEKNFQEMESKSLDSIRKQNENLRISQSEVQSLRDTNDELTAQLDALREDIKLFKTTEDLRLTKRKCAKIKKSPDLDDGSSSLCSSPFDSAQFNDYSLAVCMGLDEKSKILSNNETDSMPRIKSTQDSFTQTDKDTYIEELESSLAMLRLEYEKTEDYWAQKLSDERELYELDKMASDEKLTLIQNKIREYEEDLQGNKLSPITELYSMEKQVGDLENENVQMRMKMELMDAKLRECKEFEELVKNLSLKCEEYEKRLALLTASNDYQRQESKANASTMTQEDVEMSPGATSLKYEASNANSKPVKSMPPFYEYHVYNMQRPSQVVPLGEPQTTGKKAWTHVEVGYLNSLKQKLKQREQQCWALNQAILDKNVHSDKLLAEMKYQHNAEKEAWEQLQNANMEIARRQSFCIQEQEQKLLHLDKVLKELYTENGNLRRAVDNANQLIQERKYSNRNLFNSQNSSSSYPSSFHHFSS